MRFRPFWFVILHSAVLISAISVTKGTENTEGPKSTKDTKGSKVLLALSATPRLCDEKGLQDLLGVLGVSTALR